MPIAREQTPDPTAMMIDPPAPLTSGRKDGNGKGGGGVSKTLKAPAKRGLDSPATNAETESPEKTKKGETARLRKSGKPWADIRAAWESITGEKTGASTLPNRYLRLKANLAVVKEEDSLRLLEAKSLVEKTYENEKWTLIADQVKEMGGDR
ncbi:hypothetical protein LTR66_001279 [Elasticomyces elasticus]|nr:hypothetical protein LTR66_001279 [Elasticomyces elasticus]